MSCISPKSDEILNGTNIKYKDNKLYISRSGVAAFVTPKSNFFDSYELSMVDTIPEDAVDVVVNKF